jgi:hypothetical protein
VFKINNKTLRKYGLCASSCFVNFSSTLGLGLVIIVLPTRAWNPGVLDGLVCHWAPRVHRGLLFFKVGGSVVKSRHWAVSRELRPGEI